ncbi:putative ribonuclease H-like domain-containing protein [Tanacetum coccineum]
MVAFDGARFDWSFMADEEVPINLALMAFSNSEVHNNKTCSNTCLKSYETLKSQYDSLRIEFNKSEFDLATYKRGLASVEEQLVFYKKNEVMFCDQIAVLKRDASFRDLEINALNIQIEKLKKEKESNPIKIDNFKNASKSLDKLIGRSQIIDKSRRGVGFESYNVVAPLPIGLFAPPIIDLSRSFNSLSLKAMELRMVQKSVMNNVQNGTGQREIRPVWNNAMRTNHQLSLNSRRNFSPTAVLTKSGIVPISTARQSSSRAAEPVSAARSINTVAPKPFVNVAKPKPNAFQKHMTGNKSYLTDYQDYDGGFVAIVGSYKESVSQMCDRKNSVLFTETECLILSPYFKLPDENQIMLKIPKKDNIYSFDLKNVVPSKCLTCLFAKATNDESKLWHMRLGHINFKTMNKLVKGKLVRGLPSKIFENDHTCVACQKGKQHKTTLVTNDYSRFSWVFFLAKKDETSGILKDFITGIENQLNHKVKIIRCDNGTEFKNYEMNQFCGIKGIKREFSNARTPQQNGVAERKNRTLIEAARTMLADSLLPIPFWAEASLKQFNYCLLFTILNTLDHLGKFDGKADEGFLVGYSINSKAFRVFNSRTRKDRGKEKVPDQEYILLPLLHTSSNVPSSSEEAESSPKNDAGKKNGVKDPAKEDDINGPGEATNTNSTNRLNTISSPVNTVSSSFTTEDPGHARSQRNEFESLFGQDKDDNNAYRVFTHVNAATPSNADYSIDPLMPDLEDTANLQDTGIFGHAYDDEDVGAEADLNNLETIMSVSPIPTTRIYKDHPKDQIIGEVHSAVQTRRMAKQNEAGLITFINKQRRTNHKDFQNLEAMQEELLQFKLLNVWTLVDLPYGKKAIGTKWVFRNKKDQRGIVVRNKARLVAQGYRQEEGVDYDEVFAPVARIEAIRLFLAFASFMGFTVYQMDVKSAFLYGTIEEEVYVSQPLGFMDPEFPNRVYKVEKTLYGLHQAPRVWYETLSTYLLENRFRRGTIDKTLFIKKIKNDILLVQVYVDDIIFGSTKESLSTEFEQLMHKRFQMSSMGELTFFLGLQVEQRKDGIFLSQDKYVYDILKKFGFSSVKTASTPMETHKPLSKDADGTDVDVHLYRSMIGSLMYLTSSRPDIMFVVCACSRFQVQPKASHMHAVKRIFRYLKGQPTLGLWYPKDSPMDLMAYSDSDYAGASLDRKSTTGGCQFLGHRLILWLQETKNYG